MVSGNSPGNSPGAAAPGYLAVVLLEVYIKTFRAAIGLEGPSVHKEAHLLMSDLVQMMFK